MTKPEVVTTQKPTRSLLIFDGDCGFCRMWIGRWQQSTRDRVDYLPSQDPRVAEAYPEIPTEWYGQGVVLVEPDGRTYHAADAVMRTIGKAGGLNAVWQWLYQRVPGFAEVSEFGYRIVARNRQQAAGVARLVWFGKVQIPSLALSRGIFLRGLGAIYLFAFVSLLVQIRGLVGERGILPATEYFSAAREQLGASGFWQLPSLFWFVPATDLALQAVCAMGGAAAVLLMLGVAQLPMLVVLWALYLSLCTAGQTFLQFQWDLLLLETGLIACLLAPLALRPRLPANEGEPSRVAVWLLRWLAFRLMFQSGLVKILSGDPTWRDLTALAYHFETQPLPTLLGWLAHQAPPWWHKFNTLAMYGIELGLGLLVFAPRGLRIIAAAGFGALQVGILLTGNYGFFNLLSLLLCVPLLDDFVWPKRWGGKRLWNSREHCTEQLGTGACGIGGPAAIEAPAVAAEGAVQSSRGKLPAYLLVPAAAVMVMVTFVQAIAQLGVARWVPGPLLRLTEAVMPFRSMNSYGLFAVMTTARPEITIEGSADGESWKPYVFIYKPGPLDRAPGFLHPHMPRLDWQMWFAALGNVQRNTWLLRLQQRLLEGEPTVLRLLQENPFPDSPPAAVRARIQLYQFTTPVEKRTTGHWWKTTGEAEDYNPPLSLRPQPSPSGADEID